MLVGLSMARGTRGDFRHRRRAIAGREDAGRSKRRRQTEWKAADDCRYSGLGFTAAVTGDERSFSSSNDDVD